MQESDFGASVYDLCSGLYSPSSQSDPGADAVSSHRLADAQLGTGQSKSNTSSPIKPMHELRLVRSISAENLLSVQRKLERELDISGHDSPRTEEGLEVVASQLTNLHMS